ncbi:MAG: hypothetical protein KDC66_06570 [Phaeodactylibacter sp.]|nr:hypothetical protein [Phaeodactylibacter sp.]MCB9274349.1 hypothetical protein [Lewinellaceae bacterium]
MQKLIFLFSVSVVMVFTACKPSQGSQDTAQETPPTPIYNPPAPGFDTVGSDALAISIADSVMQAMGGRNAWDRAHYIKWDFFGNRTLLWDKYTGDVRIEVPKHKAVYIVNINDGTGLASEQGATIENPDTLQNRMQRAKSLWINDSYWLLMPFKLKDSGVTLKYGGVSPSLKGEPCDMLELTFTDVGDTPQNKYQVLVSKDSRLVVQWAYFAHASDVGPNFVTSWEDYQWYGGVLLSGKRSDRSLTGIAILDTVPEGAFTSLAPLE